jgi:hypothetical protein
MTAAVILNIFFAALVIVGMLSLLGWAIVKDARATGARVPSFQILTVRPRLRVPSPSWARKLDAAID